MAWKWYGIDKYKVSAGGANFYGIVQLSGNGFYGNLEFRKEGPLPDPSASKVGEQQRFYGYMDFQQIEMVVDLLRNEKPVSFGFWEENPSEFHLMTGAEAVGEGDGLLAG